MDGLDQAQMAKLQGLLEQRKLSLLGRMADDTAGLRVPAGHESEASPADNASARTLNELVNEAATQQALQLRVIKYALSKFADGSYGICENCGEPIGWSRLDAQPEARLCIACQTRMEKVRR